METIMIHPMIVENIFKFLPFISQLALKRSFPSKYFPKHKFNMYERFCTLLFALLKKRYDMDFEHFLDQGVISGVIMFAILNDINTISEFDIFECGNTYIPSEISKLSVTKMEPLCNFKKNAYYDLICTTTAPIAYLEALNINVWCSYLSGTKLRIKNAFAIVRQELDVAGWKIFSPLSLRGKDIEKYVISVFGEEYNKTHNSHDFNWLLKKLSRVYLYY
jgi:hypothetical protein